MLYMYIGTYVCMTFPPLPSSSFRLLSCVVIPLMGELAQECITLALMSLPSTSAAAMGAPLYVATYCDRPLALHHRALTCLHQLCAV